MAQIGSALQALGSGLGEWAADRAKRQQFAALNALRQEELNANILNRQELEADRQFRNQAYARNVASEDEARRQAGLDRTANELRLSNPGVSANYGAIAAMSPVTQTELTSGPMPALGALRQTSQATTTTPASQLFSQRAAEATEQQRLTGNPQHFVVGGETGYVPGREFSPNQELGPSDYAARAAAEENARLGVRKRYGVLHEGSDIEARQTARQRQAELNARYANYTKDRADPDNPFGPKIPGLAPDEAYQRAQQDVDLLYPRTSTMQPNAMATPSASMLGTTRRAGAAIQALTSSGSAEGVDQYGRPSTGTASTPSPRPSATSAPSPGAARSRTVGPSVSADPLAQQRAHWDAIAAQYGEGQATQIVGPRP